MVTNKTTESDSLYPEVDIDQFLPNFTGWMRASELVLLGTVFTSLVLSAVLKYKVVVKAPASIRPSGGLNLVEANRSGAIKGIAVKENQKVEAGEINKSTLEIKAKVATRDIAKVELGQKVVMRVSACPYPDYGTLKGTVTAVSPDASPPDTQTPQSTFQVTITPDSSTLSVKNKTCSIKSGMDGRSDIITEEETVLNFVLKKARLMADL